MESFRSEIDPGGASPRRAWWARALLVFAVLLASLAVAAGVARAARVGSDSTSTPSPLPTAAVSVQDQQRLVAGEAAFSADLQRRLAAGPGNFAWSPWSVSTGMAMTYVGARGATAEGIARALHFALPAPRLAGALRALEDELIQAASRGGVRLELADALWPARQLVLTPEFLAAMRNGFHAAPRQLDYTADPQTARRAINAWVASKTAGKIPTLLAPQEITTLTRLVLTDAIYLKAGWRQPFARPDTHAEPFFAPSGQVSARTMSQTASFAYRRGPGYQTVELPYTDGRLVFDVILPDPGAFARFQRDLTGARLAAALAGLTPTTLSLHLPAFTTRARFELSPPLTALGAGLAFGDYADFSGMTARPELRIDVVAHQAYVKVDEQGTEAAAATAVTMRDFAFVATAPTVRIDHPFLFAIRDRLTGAILFLGRILDPTTRAQ